MAARGWGRARRGGRRVPGAVLRSWASLRRAATSSSTLTGRCPRFSSSTEFLLAVVLQRRVPTVQTVQMTVEILQVPLLDRVVDAPAIVPLAQFTVVTVVDYPVVAQRLSPLVLTVRKTMVIPLTRCSTSRLCRSSRDLGCGR